MNGETTSDRAGGSPFRSPVERLLQRARPDRTRRLADRELLVECAFAAAFLAVAVAMPILGDSQREFHPLLAAALVLSHAAAARIRVFVGAGAAMPTQLVIVPMLLLMPVLVVPALVAGGLVLAAAVDVLRARAHPERLVTATADSWHAVGSSVVLAVAGEPALSDSGWPVIAGAVVAQCAVDLLTGIGREWLGRGITPALQIRVFASVLLIDACLTPVGLLAAWAGTQHRLGFAVVLPLLALLGAFASDRRARIEELGRRLDDLRDERLRLDEAIRRIGDAFASKLDRAALAGLALQTAREALGAEQGRAWLGDRTEEVGDADEAARLALVAAAGAARETGRLGRVREDDRFAIASPLSTGRGRADVLAVVRRGRDFSAPERALFAHLLAQTRIAVENVDLHEQLRVQATTDELTGLDNHRRFQETLREEASRARRSAAPVSLVMFDVDNFKSVNDVHGHQQGDVVLRAVARAIAGRARSTDKPARYGGEELAVVLPDTDLEGAYVAAETMRRAVESLDIALPDGASMRVTVSAGVSAMHLELTEPSDLVAAADEALYQAKRRGKNRTVRGRRPEKRFAARPDGLAQPSPAAITGQ